MHFSHFSKAGVFWVQDPWLRIKAFGVQGPGFMVSAALGLRAYNAVAVSRAHNSLRFGVRGWGVFGFRVWGCRVGLRAMSALTGRFL